jgi:uncharacterized membrane protein YgcG
LDDEQPTDELDLEPGGEGGTAVAEPPLIAAGQRLGDRYLLDRRLGHGGMSVVWLATDERLGRPVAIKVLSDVLTADATYLDRFRREAKVAAGLQHPNLVSVYDFHAGQRPYLVMEYVEGGDLARRVQRGAAPTVELLARELLAALAHIHAAGVLHRDIKPQNVLIDAHGHARLTDFGIAQPRDAASLTRTGQVVGTEAYIAPEVKAGEPASERSDLYALGVLLADIAREGAGAPLWALTDRLREQAPEARPKSAADALAELESAAPHALSGEMTQPFHVTEATHEADEPPTAVAGARAPFEPTGLGRRSATRRRWLRIGVLVAALLLVAVTALVVASSGDDGAKPAGTPQAAKGDGGSGQRSGDGGGSGGGGGSSSAEQSTTPDATTTPAEPEAATQTTADTGGGGGGATDGSALNDEGFDLVNQGRYEEAIPVLQQAVDTLRSSGDEQTYNYALYNLGSAYLGAGRYEEAIPVLQERMQFDDGQLDTVQRTLDEALAGAGQAPTGGTSKPKPPKEPKPGNPAPPGQTGAVPPGHQDENGGD